MVADILHLLFTYSVTDTLLFIYMVADSLFFIFYSIKIHSLFLSIEIS